MDLTALCGPVTGVGRMVTELATHLPAHASVELTGLLVSWRGRSQLAGVVPPGWALRPLGLPARLAHTSWRRFDRPRLRGYDVVHGPNYTVPPAAGAARLVTVHDLTAWKYPELVDHHSRTYPRHLSGILAAGGDVHTVSEQVGRELQAELGIEAARIHVVANGLGPVPVGDGARGRRLVGGPYVLAVGTIEPRKDHVSLVRAMADIWPILGDIKLVVVGGDGWGRHLVDEVVTELGVADRVQFRGYVNEADKADLLSGAELMVYPSVYEGFGLPILEAMQAGVPVVSTTAGAIPEVAGRAAVLVEPRDPTALAGAMLGVIEDESVRARLVSAGRDRASRYSWAAAAEQLVNLYHQLVGVPVPSLAVTP
jgi:glycosyltransferase involved in cell wall biosynthesis